MRTLHNLHTIDVAAGDTGVTVRNGFKWADLNKGEEFYLCVCTRDGTVITTGIPAKAKETHDVVGRGKVERLWFGYFRDIPAYLLQFEHEIRSRQYGGLYDSMRKAYGDDFGESSPVTVILYERIK